MRPIHLIMTAFGPFSGTEEIKFGDLGINPLFLINGPTGSGKTTVLDAICFALYGKSTGDEREGRQMRCDLAKSDILTEITLVFELAGKCYRIKRIPEQQRLKKNGTGYTPQDSEAELIELLDSGEERPIVAKKVKEANAEIESLTGLNADQFRQVMVLPQGKFRQLLMADSRDREQIFSNLFQTQVFKKLEENLKQQADEIKAKANIQKNVIQGNLESVGLEGIDDLDTELESLLPKHKSAQENKQKKDQEYLEATKQLQTAKSIHDQFSQLDKTVKQLKGLSDQKPEIDKKREQQQKAELAQGLTPTKNELIRCQSEFSSANKKLLETKQEKEKATRNLETAELELKQVDELSSQTDQLKQQLDKLREYSGRASKLADLQQKLKKSADLEKDKAKLVQTANEALHKITSQREHSETESQKLQQLQSVFSQQQLELKDLNDSLINRRELEEKRKTLAVLEVKLDEAEKYGKQLADTHKKKEADLKNLELRWHQGQAAILAKELEEGLPCPVCGSKDHPFPTQSAETLPTEKELDAARKGVKHSLEQLTSARENYVQINSEKKSQKSQESVLVDKLGPLVKTALQDLQKKHDELKVQVNSLVKQQKQLVKLEAQITKQKQEEQSCRKKAEEALKVHSEAKESLASIKAQEETAKLELPVEFRESGILEKSMLEKQSEIKAQEKKIADIRKRQQDCLGLSKSATASFQSAGEVQLKCEKALKAAEQSWAIALKESDFKSEEAFMASLLEKAALDVLKKEIKDFESLLSSTKGALSQQEIALKGKQKPDLSALELLLKKLQDEKSKEEKNWQDLDKRLSQLESVKQRLKKAESDKEKLEQEYSLVGTLSDVANGKTGNKVSLQRFVLSVLLDDVLVEASHRLKLMSKGRYQLLRKEDKSKRGRASGLDLEVEDAYSGKVREVATLSGGESFMAALAMALGLSDVVQSYAGGIRLDTLFIDEGFGSLDQESLDLAIRTLVDLQSTGRMIGIISHVAELKEQLPIRLDVVTDRNGSKLLIPNR